jgi:hypothetical protein
MELASHHFSDTYNFEVSPRSLKNLWAHKTRHTKETKRQGTLIHASKSAGTK